MAMKGQLYPVNIWRGLLAKQLDIYWRYKDGPHEWKQWRHDCPPYAKQSSAALKHLELIHICIR
jgi:hypothetical protein